MSRIVKYRNLVHHPAGYDEYTKALLHFDDDSAPFKDECGNTWTAYGSPAISETNAKFGKALQLNGSNYLSLNGGITLGGQDFTIDGFCRLDSSSSGWACIFDAASSVGLTSNRCFIGFNSGKACLYTAADNNTVFSSDYRGQLVHFAGVYQHDKNLWTSYINGVKQGSLNCTIQRISRNYARVGVSVYTDVLPHPFEGTIDEFRISRGALWTANFTPPTEPYSDEYETVKNPVASDILIHTADGVKAIAKCKKTPTLTFSKDTVNLYKKGTADIVTYTTDSDGEVSIGTSIVPTLTTCSLSGNSVLVATGENTYDYGDGSATTGSESFTVTVTVAESREYEAISKSFTVNSYRWGALSEHTPAQIQQAAKLGIAPLLWSVGDMTSGITIAKTTLGTYGGVTQYIAAGTYYARILGFNHNSSLEGDKTIHFALATTSNGTDIAFVEGSGNQILYGTTYSSAGTKGELMHKRSTTASNANGWSGSYIKGTMLPRILAKIDSSWTNVMKAVTKYTDNAGNKSTAESAVTSTSDKLFIPSDFEVSGATTEYVNSYEASKQKQYDYFKNHKLRYKHNATNTACIWWLRSPAVQNSTNFRCVNASGNTNGGNANYSYGVVPCFVIA